MGKRHYCRQCSIQRFGIDFRDFRQGKLYEDALGDRLVYCWNCGSTLVDAMGNCLIYHEEHMRSGDSEYKDQADEILARFFSPQYNEPLTADEIFQGAQATMNAVPISNDQGDSDEPPFETGNSTFDSGNSSDDPEA